ncbi:MAG: GntR family transcriptional regulator [Microbacteriaceae bacterium]
MFTDESPLFQQLADRIADDIAAGTYPEETAVPSATDFAVFFHMNPATVSKGVNLLVDLGVLYKKRGIGMFVASGARDTLRRRRLSEFQDKYVEPLLAEARVLGIDSEDLQRLIIEKVKDHA